MLSSDHDGVVVLMSSQQLGFPALGLHRINSPNLSIQKGEELSSSPQLLTEEPSAAEGVVTGGIHALVDDPTLMHTQAALTASSRL